MMGTKARIFAPIAVVSLEDLVPSTHFYRHLDHVLDLSCVRDLVNLTIHVNPSDGNSANIGEGSILRDKTIGCLVTNTQVTIASSLPAFPLKGTSW